MSETGGNLLQIGQVLKSNGTDGELVIGFFDIAPEEFDCKEPVFIYFDGLPVPFFIEALSPKGSSRALVRLTGVRSLEDADEIVGRKIFAEGEEGQEEDDFGALVGWTVKDADGRLLGTVTGFEDIPGNPCIDVDTGHGEAMLPLHEDLLLKVDKRSKTLIMKIPEGLI